MGAQWVLASPHSLYSYSSQPSAQRTGPLTHGGGRVSHLRTTGTWARPSPSYSKSLLLTSESYWCLHPTILEIYRLYMVFKLHFVSLPTPEWVGHSHPKVLTVGRIHSQELKTRQNQAIVLKVLLDQIQSYVQCPINSSFHSKLFICLKTNSFTLNFWR